MAFVFCDWFYIENITKWNFEWNFMNRSFRPLSFCVTVYQISIRIEISSLNWNNYQSGPKNGNKIWIAGRIGICIQGNELALPVMKFLYTHLFGYALINQRIVVFKITQYIEQQISHFIILGTDYCLYKIQA